jgi:RimJ/RimL family protein N-acetyltransferase
VGDINLFFSKWIEPNQAEINIMIARRDHRGKGFAREVLILVEAFARVQYGRNEIIAKIKDDNAASMRLFEKMGYQLINHSEHFQETEFRKRLDQPIEEYQKVLSGMEEVLEVNELFGN